MKKNTHNKNNEIGELAAEARALMDATAHLTGQKVKNARKNLALALEQEKANGKNVAEVSADMAADTIKNLHDHIGVALNHGKKIYGKVHDDMTKRTQAAKHAVHMNPYPMLAIVLGAGTLVGYMVAFGLSRRGH